MLRVNNLSGGPSKTDIIKNVSFTAERGIVGIIGKNGAGKTTLIKSLISPAYRHGGEIFADGTELTGLSCRERAKIFAYAPQETAAAFNCTVREFVLMGRAPYLKLLQNPSKTDGIIADEALSELGISHLADRYTDEISGGEKRLAYLARAKVQNAPYLLLDEPTAGLDFGKQHGFFEFLEKYVKNNGAGALVTIHDPTLAYRYCDGIIIMDSGTVTAQLSKTDESFDEKYLSAICSLYGCKAEFAETGNIKTIVRTEDGK